MRGWERAASRAWAGGARGRGGMGTGGFQGLFIFFARGGLGSMGFGGAVEERGMGGVVAMEGAGGGAFLMGRGEGRREV